MQMYKRALEKFIKFEGSIADLKIILSGLPPEVEVDQLTPLVLAYQDIARVLQRYLERELSGADVYFWASEIELRDDFEFGHDGEYVFQVVFKLATPELEGDLTPERAQRLLDVLQSGMPSEQEIHDAYR